jgi:hypothetical protein
MREPSLNQRRERLGCRRRTANQKPNTVGGGVVGRIYPGVNFFFFSSFLFFTFYLGLSFFLGWLFSEMLCRSHRGIKRELTHILHSYLSGN